MTNKTKIQQCEFAYQCPKTWDSLLETNIESVRYCESCERNVFLSASVDEAYHNAEQGRCVAIPIRLTPYSERMLHTQNVVGMIGPPPIRYIKFDERNHGGNADKPVFFGLDGCKAGWFCIGIDDEGDFRFSVLKKIDDLQQYLEQAKLILVDIPIGLPWRDQATRLCDTAARRILAPRGSSVFPVPARSALSMPSYQQGIEERIAILSSHYKRAEKCFCMARDQYLVKEVASDDILDAMVGAVTAMQYPRLSTLPEKPVKDEEGIPMEMVYCGDV
jgi:predicted RNase H-like nuclease